MRFQFYLPKKLSVYLKDIPLSKINLSSCGVQQPLLELEKNSPLQPEELETTNLPCTCTGQFRLGAVNHSEYLTDVKLQGFKYFFSRMHPKLSGIWILSRLQGRFVTQLLWLRLPERLMALNLRPKVSTFIKLKPSYLSLMFFHSPFLCPYFF